MPSGAKKRKAAKKKKEIQPNTHPSQSKGGEDVKHQDDKDSDVGEGNSPNSQDNHSHENILNEGEEEGTNSSDLTPAEGEKIEAVDDANIGSKEFRIGDGSNEKDGRFEHGGTSRSSSSSSSGPSDDESHGVDSSQVEEVTAVRVGLAKAADVSSWKIDADSNTVSIERTNFSTVESSEDISSTSYKTETVEDQRPCGEDKVGIFTASEEADLEQEDAIITSVEAIAVKEGATHTMETVVNGANSENGSRATENALAPATHPVCTTSWKNCCGLFEVFTGSGR